ncbi:Glycosyltransferase involved in cell wall bisynthesis [Verrucomicrobium sp. GAS474]|uniref:hypothetical protein n=1 Tax=Verrucomicrobium sp. GAS474 TaxID=1882831 RepID=UPI00087BACDE|nr:hypothetical protein [Verrucomicrobium sp. GAS474]SDT98577.1 Glycosyltransferase involved in cell wall bisynthesis [Verrucomicrobium sp. GAS474]
MKPRLFILSPELHDDSGHYLPYDLALQKGAAALGLDSLVLTRLGFVPPPGSPLAFRPAFRHDIWGKNAVPGGADGRLLAKGVPTEKLRAAFANRAFLADLRTHLPASALTPESVVFVHSFLHGQIAGLVDWYAALPPARRPQLKLLFRYPFYFFDAAFLDAAFEALHRLPGSRESVTCFSDSEELARLYGARIGRPVHLLPFPHASFADADPEAREREARPIRCVSLGNARIEKGFAEIVDALFLLRETGDAAPFEFVLQASSPEAALRPRIARLREAALPGVTLLDEAISETAYAALIESADVILAPYHEEAYADRTSGIVADAIGAGKIVLTPADSCPGRRIASAGTGLFCANRSPASVAALLRGLPVALPRLRREAAQRQKEWKAHHNARRFVSLLLAHGEPCPPAPATPASPSLIAPPAPETASAGAGLGAVLFFPATWPLLQAAAEKEGLLLPGIEVHRPVVEKGFLGHLLLGVLKALSLSWLVPSRMAGVPTRLDLARLLLFSRIGRRVTWDDLLPLFLPRALRQPAEQARLAALAAGKTALLTDSPRALPFLPGKAILFRSASADLFDEIRARTS